MKSTDTKLCDVYGCQKPAVYQRDTNHQYACSDHALPHDLMQCKLINGNFTWQDEAPTFGTWIKLNLRSMTTLRDLIFEAPSSTATELLVTVEELLEEVADLREAFKVNKRSDVEERLHQIVLSMRRKVS